LKRHFRSSLPTIRQMVNKLQASGLMDRTPGEAKALKGLIHPSPSTALRCLEWSSSYSGPLARGLAPLLGILPSQTEADCLLSHLLAFK